MNNGKSKPIDELRGLAKIDNSKVQGGTRSTHLDTSKKTWLGGCGGITPQ
jgi:hypothetical protein